MRIVILIASVSAFAACTLDWDALDPALRSSSVGGEMSTGGEGGEAAGGSFGGNGGTALGGMGGAGNLGGGGAGGVGGMRPTLYDGGLVVRYFLDEAATGTDPTVAEDAAPNPFPLSSVYANNAYVVETGNRGMQWPAATQDGVFMSAIENSKVTTELAGSTTGTIECVFDIDACEPLSSRIFHVGEGSDAGNFTLSCDSVTNLNFAWENGDPDDGDVHWTVDLLAVGRAVFHVVLDTGLAAGQRLRLFINGALQPQGTGVFPLAGEFIIFEPGDSLTLGNRATGGRSFDGTLFYCAAYNEALSIAAIQNNTTILLASDDAP